MQEVKEELKEERNKRLALQVSEACRVLPSILFTVYKVKRAKMQFLRFRP